jgi:Flp pilus assembly protein TadB
LIRDYDRDKFFLPRGKRRNIIDDRKIQAIIKGGIIMLSGILWAVVAVLVILWLVGFVIVHVSGGLIHLLLLAAVIVLIYNLVVGSRTRRTM